MLLPDPVAVFWLKKKGENTHMAVAGLRPNFEVLVFGFVNLGL